MKVYWDSDATAILLLVVVFGAAGFCHGANASESLYLFGAFKFQKVIQANQVSASRDSIHGGKVYLGADKMPQLKGTLKGLYKKVQYPEKCRKAGIQGRVYVQFVVNKKGLPTHVHVLRGIGSGCDDAAITAVKKYASFTPGMNSGKPVRVQMALPILFKLVSRKKVYINVDKEPRLAIPYTKFESKVTFPEKCRKAGIQGRVILEMIIDREGKPRNVHVLKGIGGSCDEAAVKSVEKYATFSPAKLHGVAVKTRIKFPVIFKDYYMPDRDKKVYRSVVKPPKMTISYRAFKRQVKYPKSCRQAGVEGPVTVQFVVNKQGIPTDIHVVKGIGWGCDQAVVNAIRRYLRFTPGMANGKPVPVKKYITVMFILNDNY